MHILFITGAVAYSSSQYAEMSRVTQGCAAVPGESNCTECQKKQAKSTDLCSNKNVYMQHCIHDIIN